MKEMMVERTGVVLRLKVVVDESGVGLWRIMSCGEGRVHIDG